MQANAYLIKPENTSKALLVDPGDDVPSLLAFVEKTDVGGVLVTHGHRDHAGGLQEIVRTLDIPVLAHPWECNAVGQIDLPDDPDGICLQVGGVPVQVLHCPGHTAHSCAFAVSGALFTGDTLFAGSLGRAADVASYPQLLNSGRRYLSWPDNTPIYPGHGPATTVGQEKTHNPFLAKG
jgi:glyoxylase-like metal-dependent hydrolase (beta-lactamase superfamily II)